ncbi:hypothetical protein QFZ20_002198 [Flavobacterium sp. W4I14]|nr:hypothetical protein [Flavobacterium sp. W4I14]
MIGQNDGSKDDAQSAGLDQLEASYQAQVADGGPKPKKKTPEQIEKEHEAEVKKYGVIKSVIALSAGVSIVGGGTYEFGYFVTDKNWIQYYQTFYYSHGFSNPFLSFGAAKVVPCRGKSVTISDFAGGFGGMSMSIGYIGGNVGSTSSYFSYGAGATIGKPLSFMKDLKGSGTYNIGVTTLLGKPIHAVADFSRSYIKTYTYLGGR